MTHDVNSYGTDCKMEKIKHKLHCTCKFLRLRYLAHVFIYYVFKRPVLFFSFVLLYLNKTKLLDESLV